MANMSNPNQNWGSNPFGQPNANQPPNPFGAPRPDAGPNPYGQHAAPHLGHQVRPDMDPYAGMQRHTGPATDQSQAFMTKVFGWMAMGLGLTAIVAYFTFSTGLFIQLQPFMLPLVFGQLGLVMALSFLIKRMNAPTAIGAFLLYAAMNGLTFSVILAIYTVASIGQVFLVTFMTFGFMFVYGWTTKKDLTSWGSLLFMGLIGLIIAGVVNMFVGGEMMSFVISVIGVLVFVGLTAYDAQKIKQIGAYGFADGDTEQKVAIIGALRLYLDFINLFLYLLRLLGDRR